ncbi:Sec-independent protein translocase protein TatB [soil metagenome]
MFNVGGGELFVILLLGLLVLGPERLPKAMGQVGKYVAQLRKLSSGFQDEIRRAMDPDDAPFRPGEERLPAGNVADEVRVVGADPDPGEPDTPAGPLGPEPSAAGNTPSTGPDDAVAAPDPEPEAIPEPEPESGTVTPLHGHDDGDARAAG